MSDDAEGQMTDDGANGGPAHRIDSRPLKDLTREDVAGALLFCADRFVLLGDHEDGHHVQFLRHLAAAELDPGLVTVHLPQAATVVGELLMFLGETYPDCVMDNRGPDETVVRERTDQETRP